MKAKSIIALALALLLGACMTAPEPGPAAAPQAAREHAVYVIRHLQKAQGPDPSLTQEGAANAQLLADMLEGEAIGAVYATPTARAVQTGEPLARRLGLSVTPYDARDGTGLAASLAALDAPALVVGHSNTVGDLVSAFGGSPVPVLTEADYGTLYRVDPDGSVTEIAVE
ncbi:histidine phosphatase family protein [Qipengyuania nanhaisediminis]|uniref:histidine phosphatase family protein n=1 Tax=Qipengyuania nanhaisediminis TaxID=604088 RepID=UPI0038B270C7